MFTGFVLECSFSDDKKRWLWLPMKCSGQSGILCCKWADIVGLADSGSERLSKCRLSSLISRMLISTICQFNLFNLKNKSHHNFNGKVQEIVYYAESRFWCIINEISKADAVRQRLQVLPPSSYKWTWGEDLTEAEVLSLCQPHQYCIL